MRDRQGSPPPVRVLVVDDEPLAREGLTDYLERETDLEVVGECADGEDAVQLLAGDGIDLVFLDVEMPGMSGFDVIEAVGADAMPPVVFVTAYDRFALQAFEACAVDYVLKPLDPDRIARAVERARRFVDREPWEAQLGDLLRHLQGRRSHIRRFPVREDERVRFVDVDDVVWIEADANYAVLHTGEGHHRLRVTMLALEDRLDPDLFMRVHRSAFVRVDRIRTVELLGQGDYLIVMDSGARVTTSRSYRSDVRSLLEGVG